MVTVYSSIRPALLRKTLYRGTALAAVGGVFLLGGGTLLSQDSLERWGIVLFAIASFCIGCGLIPYRRLVKLEQEPFKILVDERELLTVFLGNTPHLELPLSSIKKVRYLEEGDRYGIGLWLDPAIKAKSSIAGCDLFLPYFSDSSCCKLNAHLSCINPSYEPKAFVLTLTS